MTKMSYLCKKARKIVAAFSTPIGLWRLESLPPGPCILTLIYSDDFLGFGLGVQFIYQGTSTRRQRRNHCGLRVKLPSVTTSL